MRNAVAAPDREGLFAMVDQGDFDLPPKIRVNSARGIDNADAVFDGEPASRPDLGLAVRGKRHGKAGGNKRDISRRQNHRVCYRRTDIHSG